MTFLFHSVIFRIITIHMLNTGKILPENILTFTQDARKEKINCSSDPIPLHRHWPRCAVHISREGHCVLGVTQEPSVPQL